MKKIITTILVIVFVSLTIAIGICNWIHNDTFFTASVTQVLTLAITLGIAFWATQYKSDVRKMKEHAETVLRKIQILVSDELFYSIPAEGNIKDIQKQINATNRKITNCITILDEYAKTLDFNMDYIRREFDTYKSRVGEHISDLEYLSKSENEFKRIAENIDSKCDYIILDLYK